MMRFERLGNMVDIKKGRKPKLLETPVQDSIRFLQIDDLRNDDNIKYTSDKTGILAYEDDVLIAWDGANAGTIGFGKSGYIGSTIALLRKKIDSEFNTAFIGKFLQSQFTYLRSKASGATIPHIDRKSLENLRIPVLPLNDQIRVADILSKAEVLISQRKECLRLLAAFLKSTFLERFGDPVRNEKGWATNCLENLVAEDCPLTYGVVQPGEDFPTGIPVVRPVDLTRIIIRKNVLKCIDPKISSKFKRTILKGNEILMCVRGTTGTIALASRELQGCNVTRGITPIWFSENFNTLFACGLLSSQAVNSEIQKLTYGSTLKQINLSDLRKLKLINPPLHLQKEFGSLVEKAEALKACYQTSLQELENLYGSLSQRAFKGELELKDR